MKKYISVLLILLFCTTAYSQAENNPEKKNNSSNSITTFEEKFAVSIKFETPSIDYDLEYLSSEDTTTTPIEYRQEEGEVYSISASYLEYAVSLSFDDSVNEISDFKISKYSRKYWIDLNYQKYKGFSIDNPSDFGLSEDDPAVDHSDLKITNYSANYVHIFSDDFSIAAAMEQTERQNTWDWTFLLGASTGRYEINSKTSMLPPSEELLYEDYSGYKGGKYYYIAMMPGIGLTIPFYNFFFTASALVGGGYAYEISQTADGEISSNTSMYKFLGKGSIGYNGDNFFARFTISFDQTEVNLFTFDTANPKVALVSGALAAGVRF